MARRGKTRKITSMSQQPEYSIIAEDGNRQIRQPRRLGAMPELRDKRDGKLLAHVDIDNEQYLFQCSVCGSLQRVAYLDIERLIAIGHGAFSCDHGGGDLSPTWYFLVDTSSTGEVELYYNKPDVR